MSRISPKILNRIKISISEKKEKKVQTETNSSTLFLSWIIIFYKNRLKYLNFFSQWQKLLYTGNTEINCIIIIKIKIKILLKFRPKPTKTRGFYSTRYKITSLQNNFHFLSAEWRGEERPGPRCGRRERGSDESRGERHNVAKRERAGQGGADRRRGADEEGRAAPFAAKRDEQQREHTLGQEDGGTGETDHADLETPDPDLRLRDRWRFEAVRLGQAAPGTTAPRRAQRLSAALRPGSTPSPSGTSWPASSRRHDGLQRLRGAQGATFPPTALRPPRGHEGPHGIRRSARRQTVSGWAARLDSSHPKIESNQIWIRYSVDSKIIPPFFFL